MVNADRSPAFQTIEEYWSSFPTSVTGQWYCSSPGEDPPMQFPMPLVGPFTSQVSYFKPRLVRVWARKLVVSRPLNRFTKRIEARLSVHPSGRLVGCFTGRTDADR